ncbi:unnamed protein product [Caretta caretta]
MERLRQMLGKKAVKWVRDRAKQLRFLHAIPTLCFSAQKQGQDTLELHCSRAALVESTAELIEDLPLESEPSSILSSSVAAVCNLSKLKPPLELESHLLRAVLYSVFTMGTGKDTAHFQALHKAYADSLDIMLRSLLMKTPTMDKLQHLLESSSDFSKVGYLVAQLGLYIIDPAYDISRNPGRGFTGSTSYCCRRGASHQQDKLPSLMLGTGNSSSDLCQPFVPLRASD